MNCRSLIKFGLDLCLYAHFVTTLALALNHNLLRYSVFDFNTRRNRVNYILVTLDTAPGQLKLGQSRQSNESKITHY